MHRAYRKLPVEIAALQFDGENFEEIHEFCGAALLTTEAGPRRNTSGQICIKTLEGWLWASRDDYIIRGVQGEFYPCKPDIFAQTYELVELEDDLEAITGEHQEDFELDG